MRKSGRGPPFQHHGHHRRRRGLAVGAGDGDRACPAVRAASACARARHRHPRTAGRVELDVRSPMALDTTTASGRVADCSPGRARPKTSRAQRPQLVQTRRVLEVRARDRDRPARAAGSRGRASRRRRSRSGGGASRSSEGTSSVGMLPAAGERGLGHALAASATTTRAVRGVRLRPRAARAPSMQPVRVVHSSMIRSAKSTGESSASGRTMAAPTRASSRAFASWWSSVAYGYGHQDRREPADGDLRDGRRPGARHDQIGRGVPSSIRSRNGPPWHTSALRALGGAGERAVRDPARSAPAAGDRSGRPNTGRAAATAWSRCSAPWLPPDTMTVRRAGRGPAPFPPPR